MCERHRVCWYLGATLVASACQMTVHARQGPAPISNSGGPVERNAQGALIVQNLNANETGLGLLSSCRADFNKDGFLTFEDFDAFVGAFEGGQTSSDTNGDGFIDCADFDDFVNAFEAGCVPPFLGALFSNPRFAVGVSPFCVATDDLDGDHVLDLVVVNSGANTLSVLRGMGNASFASSVEYATGAFPTSVAIGDVNGDGMRDVVVTNWGNGGAGRTISIFLNSGSGVFAPKKDLTVGAGPFFAAIGDIDRDGSSDIAVTNTQANSVSVLRGIGGGLFEPKRDYPTGSGPGAISLVDIDSNLGLDVVVANFNAGTVSVLRNTGGVSFAPRVDFSAGAGATAVAVGDADGDGKPDVAVANFTASTVSVLRNTATSAGVVAFGPKADYAVARSPTSLVWGDFDRDGTPDLAVAASYSELAGNSGSVLRNLGDGTFRPREDYIVGWAPRSLAAGDFDQDGDLDLVFANREDRSVSMLQNQGNGQFAQLLQSSVGTAPRTIRFGDLDGDCTPDAVLACDGGNYVSVRRGLGGGAFAPETRVGATAGAGVVSGVLSDLDSDGRLDIVFVMANRGTIAVRRNVSDGPGSLAFEEPIYFRVGAYPLDVESGDLNSDGKPDLVVANGRASGESQSVSVLLNTSTATGSITFGPEVKYPTGAGPSSIAIGDLDGDLCPEIVAGNEAGMSVSMLRNLGNGTFGTRVDYPVASFTTCVEIADIDDDGKPDLLATNNHIASISIFKNISESGAPLSFAPRKDVPTGSYPRAIVVTDLDGDGSKEIITANAGNTNTVGTVSILMRSASTPDWSRVDYATGSALSAYDVAVCDVNRDGKPDLGIANYAADALTILLNRTSRSNP